MVHIRTPSCTASSIWEMSSRQRSLDLFHRNFRPGPAPGHPRFVLRRGCQDAHRLNRTTATTRAWLNSTVLSGKASITGSCSYLETIMRKLSRFLMSCSARCWRRPPGLRASRRPILDFQINRYEPTAAGEWSFWVDHPLVLSTRYFAAGITLNYAHNPLVFGTLNLTAASASSRGHRPSADGHVDLAGSFSTA